MSDNTATAADLEDRIRFEEATSALLSIAATYSRNWRR